MQRFIAATFLVVIFIILLPMLIVSIPEKQTMNELSKLENNNKIEIKVFNHETEKITVMNLEEYLVGVVAAEMPAGFNEEALKAQAIAARTYTLKRMLENRQEKNSIHPGADICTDFVHHQAWISVEEMKARWGSSNFIGNFNKIQKAVFNTQGIILLYNGKLVDPVFHADCGGTQTENAGDVWQTHVPYLVSVACLPREDSEQTAAEVKMSVAKFDQTVGTNLKALPVSTLTDNKVIKILEKTEGGGVRLVKIGEKSIKGVDLRKKLSLKSTNFTIKLINGEVVIKTIGNGHGVGLCQVGANEYAKQGYNYQEILSHYYTGIKIVNLKTK